MALLFLTAYALSKHKNRSTVQVRIDREERSKMRSRFTLPHFLYLRDLLGFTHLIAFGVICK